MSAPTDPLAAFKQAAAEQAVNAYVKSGMTVGLGTGSTIKFGIDLLGAKLKRGELRDVVGVSTSERTTEQARGLGIPLVPLQQAPTLDVAIDGADEVAKTSGAFFLIKGLGGALLREKEVAKKSREFIVVVDDSKLVRKLGTKSPLPVEVDPAAAQAVSARLAALGGAPALRLRAGSGEPYVTDNGNGIVDVRWPNGIDDPEALARSLEATVGVRAHGLFLRMAVAVVVASRQGVVTVGLRDALPGV